MNYLIGIDIGTSGTKTALFDDTGKLVASHTVSYPLYQPQNGWAEQNPEDWYNAAVTSLKEVVKSVNSEDIRGIGLSGQMHGLVMLDKNNDVIRPSIIWCDQRTSAECDEVTHIIGRERLIDITANPALTGFTASKILWVKNNEPENFKKCTHIMLPKDYVRFKMTDAFSTDVSDASGMQLLDIKNRKWSDEILSKLDINIDMLCNVLESPETSGYISKEFAEITGLKEGTPVAAGAGDNAASAIGTGVYENEKAFVTIGTSGVVFAQTDEPIVDLQGRVHTFCCAVPGKWHVMGVTQAAGLSLKWFKENFCPDISYKKIDDMVAETPIGANRLIYLPYLMGERTPHLDANARGVFFGLSAIHNMNDMLRAVMEGVNYSLTDCKNILSEMGINPKDIVACGGGGSSRIWRDMLANCFNIPVNTLAQTEGAALGAAILGGVCSGTYSSIADGCKRTLSVKTQTLPNVQLHNNYMKFYNIYKDLYNSLKDHFAAISSL